MILSFLENINVIWYSDFKIVFSQLNINVLKLKIAILNEQVANHQDEEINI